MQLGIDLGGTKAEVIVLDDNGAEIFRHRVPSAQGDYNASIATIKDLIEHAETAVGQQCSLGMGMPGIVSPVSGLMKNANSTWLNNKALDKDLSKAVGRWVRTTNDANCLAVSEAADGAGAGKDVVLALILGTGAGAGIVAHGHIHNGCNGSGGEFGHITLPWQTKEEFENAPDCYCGHRGCIETWVSGTGFQNDYFRRTGNKLKGKEIVALAEQGDAAAKANIADYQSRLGRYIAMLVNGLDPDIIVVGGGMCNTPFVDTDLTSFITPYVFGNEFQTPIVKAKHGDSSGVRGAAWLWGKEELSQALQPYKGE